MNESRLIKETQIMQQSNWYKWLQLNQCNQHFLVTCGLYRSEAIYVHLSCPGGRLTSIWIIVQMQIYKLSLQSGWKCPARPLELWIFRFTKTKPNKTKTDQHIKMCSDCVSQKPQMDQKYNEGANRINERWIELQERNVHLNNESQSWSHDSKVM
jgi:hypothetical protein